MIEIKIEEPQHGPLVDNLLDLVFGPDRRAKAVYSLREGVKPIESLCLVALIYGKLHGSIRFWPVSLEDAENTALTKHGSKIILLGPLAVDPLFQGLGIGRVLVEYSLLLAEKKGYSAAVLVGDPAYYRRFGFRRSKAQGINIAAEPDQDRVLMREIVVGAAKQLVGSLVCSKKALVL